MLDKLVCGFYTCSILLPYILVPIPWTFIVFPMFPAHPYLLLLPFTIIWSFLELCHFLHHLSCIISSFLTISCPTSISFSLFKISYRDGMRNFSTRYFLSRYRALFLFFSESRYSHYFMIISLFIYTFSCPRDLSLFSFRIILFLSCFVPRHESPFQFL